MKRLEKQNNAPSDGRCADEVLATVPLIMRTIITEMRNQRPSDLSAPQFRVLSFLHRHEGSSLSELASQQGLALPTVSKMIDGLVKRGLVLREASSDDRRRVMLDLTDEGRSAFEETRRYARARLAVMLEDLSPEEQQSIVSVMGVLRRIFTPDPKA